MATNTGGGTTASLSNTPQAKEDTFYREEDLAGIALLDVMSNDLAGNAKVLWSVDNGPGSPTDLIATDIGKIESTATDVSAHGAKIWIQNGQVAYQSNTLDAAFKASLQALGVGETATDTFTYAIRMSNGTLSWTTATIVFTGTNDGPDISVGSSDSASKTLTETNSVLSTTGTLTVVDPDTSDTVAVSITGFGKSGNSGTLTNAQLQAMLTLTEFFACGRFRQLGQSPLVVRVDAPDVRLSRGRGMPDADLYHHRGRRAWRCRHADRHHQDRWHQ